MIRTHGLWASLVCAAILFTGCTDEVDVNAVASCVPGEERLCPCVGGSQAIQVCAPDGTYDPCDCPSTDPGDVAGSSCAPDEEQACTTTCESAGSQLCGADGVYGACQVPDEVCNDADDDCDDAVDEGLDCESCYEGSTEPCETSCGTEGRRTCGPNDFWEECAPPSETCNNVDDDCDGFTDEALSQSCVNACGEGIEACIDGKWTGCTAPQPTIEICDDQDNNCDGSVDLAANGTPLETLCETPCGPGTRLCLGGSWSSCGIGVEICDNLDNDCDDAIDEDVPGGCACPEETSQECGTDEGECSPGTQSCINGAWSPCTGEEWVDAVPEICDGLDNDCDGLTDEGNPGGGDSCGTPNAAQGGEVTLPCQEGSLSCVGGQLECSDGVDPTPESCDGIDNDCNGVVDDKPTSDQYEPNDTCDTLEEIGTVVEGQATLSIHGTLYPGSDVDWYKVNAQELADACVPLTGEGTFVLTVTMTPPPDKDYDLCVWPADEMTCSDLSDTGLCMDLGIWELKGAMETYTALWDGSCNVLFPDDRDFYIKVVTYDPDKDFDCVPYHIEVNLVSTD